MARKKKSAHRRVVGECPCCFPKTRKLTAEVQYETPYVLVEMAIHRLYGITSPIVGAA